MQPPALPDWLAPELPFKRAMAQVGAHRMHYIDEGQGRAVLLVHGNPTWCFLWRKVIHRLVPGFRVIAPDLLGLGLSDKLRRPSHHQLDVHIEAVRSLVTQLDLSEVILVGQDWGGPIAAGVGSREPQRVHGLVFGNTGVLVPRRPLRTKGFHRLSHVPVLSDLLFRVGGFPLQALDRVQGHKGSIGKLERRAYRWPLKRPWDRAAPIGMARMVPNSEQHPSIATQDDLGAWVQSWKGPAALVWGLQDPILGRGLRRHREALPQATVFETDAGHFSQEEIPAEWAEAIRTVSA